MCFVLQPLSDEMKREIRRDARVYKENKAKLRKLKEMCMKRRMDTKESNAELMPTRKVRKLTEGLPHGSKGDVDMEKSRSGSHSTPSFRASKSSAFVSFTADAIPPSSKISATTFSMADSSSTRPLPNPRPTTNLSSSLTQSIVNKLPSIGHKFIGDTEKLIMKNTIKPIQAELASPSIGSNARASSSQSHQVDKIDLQDHQLQPELKQIELQQQQQLEAHEQQPTVSTKKVNVSVTSSSTKP